jgi:hypothetical protein
MSNEQDALRLTMFRSQLFSDYGTTASWREQLIAFSIK